MNIFPKNKTIFFNVLFFFVAFSSFLSGEKASLAFQKFLDSHQYTPNNILRYEWVFGKGFISTGGITTTQEYTALLDLKPNQKVLDVGCGVGGGDFYMEEKYGVKIVAVDLSSNMLCEAIRRGKEKNSSVQFILGNILSMDFPQNSFDVIYTRDTLLHIPEKLKLFKKFYSWLKPGGKLLISDYCKGEEEPSKAFKAYIDKYGYDLHTIKDYVTLLQKAGFKEVQGLDKTDLFVESMKRELKHLEETKAEFLKKFTLEDYNHIVDGWNDKLKRSDEGEQKWGLFYAIKKI